MSDLYDANQSPLRVAHRFLSENDRLYRACLMAAPTALVVALIAGTMSLVWSPATPLPPAAVPARPPWSPPPPAAPAQPPVAPVVDLLALRDRAVTDATAMNDLRARAGTGNFEAQFYMGTLYDPLNPSIRFSPKDAVTAADWYEKSANQGYAYAQNNLGWLYQNGQGRPKDDAAAAGWYRKAAVQNDAMAQVNLGALYETGHGLNKDEAEAARWYRMAADLGTPAGMDNLGRLYEGGRGVAKDEAEAARWFRKAADTGLAPAQNDLARLYQSGRGVPKDDTEAARWYEKAAAQNDHAAENELGRMYATGEGIPVDLDRALGLFRQAASAGDPAGGYNLALFLDKGWGAPRNPLASYIWYSITTRLGDPERRGQAASERDRLAREINRNDLPIAQRAADNWQPGSHGRIGVAIQDLTPEQARAIGSTQPKGAIIAKVEDGSPAQRAGLEAQDVVTAVDGEPMANAAAFRGLVSLGVPGQLINLWVEKSRQRGSVQNIRVQLDRATQ